MSSTSMELTERLYRRLLEAARERDGELRPTLTIGDLYQELIPYRAVRGELGVFELAEYENALLRLLAGDGGYLRLVDDAVRGELSSELRSPNPILGIYRDYPAQVVELTWVRRDDPAAYPPQAHPDRHSSRASEDGGNVRSIDELISEDELQDDAEADPAADAPQPLPTIEYPPPRPMAADATRVVRPTPASPVSTLEDAPTSASCRACGEPLPEVDGLRYCPHCGADQSEVPCAHCGTAIRASWNFCIRCGSPRSSAPR